MTAGDPSLGHAGTGDDREDAQQRRQREARHLFEAKVDAQQRRQGLSRFVETQEDAQQRQQVLLLYLFEEEYEDYRAILGVFAGTSSAEFTPDDVAAKVAGVDPAVIPDRMESLRRWGHLMLSIRAPSTLADYYRLHSLYMITPDGEGLYKHVEEMNAVSRREHRPGLAPPPEPPPGLPIPRDSSSG